MLAASTGGGQEDQRARGFTRPICPRAVRARARPRTRGFWWPFILCAALRAIQTGGGQEDQTRSRCGDLRALAAISAESAHAARDPDRRRARGSDAQPLRRSGRAGRDPDGRAADDRRKLRKFTLDARAFCVVQYSTRKRNSIKSARETTKTGRGTAHKSCIRTRMRMCIKMQQRELRKLHKIRKRFLERRVISLRKR